MAETTGADALNSGDSGDSKKQKSGGIKGFIRKNKTLSAVAAVGGLYFIWKMRQEPAAESTPAEAAEAGSTEGLVQTGQLEQYETGRAERAEERAEADSEEMEGELQRERERRKETEEEKENPSPSGDTETPEPAPPTAAAGSGVSLHGKNFPGATGSHIAKTGQTPGGKKYVEYAIQYPGRIEHWQYFTDSGNWRQVRGSSGAAGSQEKKPGASGNPTSPGQAGKTTGGSGTTQPKKKMGIAAGVVVGKPAPHSPPPQQLAQHPQAVNTGNRCVNGGVGAHKAPAGYHLFCKDGYIWRAPN